MSAEHPESEVEALRARLDELEETLRAIRAGAVDALVVGDGPERRVYTLDGADRAYRLWVEQISQGAATLYPDGTIAYCNPRLGDLLGWPCNTLPTLPLSDFIPASERHRYESLLERSRLGSAHEEFQLVRGDGSLISVLLTLNALPIESGAALGVLVTDLTSQKREDELTAALAALEFSDSQRRAHVQQVKDYAIFRTDPHGLATTWNEGVQRVLGFDEEEFLGRDITKIIFTPSDVAAGVPQRELEVAANTGTANNDRWMRRKDGVLFWATGVTTALRDGSGVLVGFTKVMRDQTQWKRAADELRDARIRLEEADRRKNEFLATLAHELRNPLAPIRTGLQILELAKPDGPEASRARAMMERQLAHMVRLIDDLLDVSRISSGKIELRIQRLSLRTIFDAALETSLPLIEGARHSISVSLPEEPIHVDGDLTRLAQVLSNLLNNAAKYTPEGGLISLSAERDGSEAVVRVRDSGIGIGEEMLENVFELFSQVGNASDRSRGGLGIGLALVRRLVELHGGSVGAKSDGLGRGSEFCVRLPAAATAAGEPIGRAPLAAARGAVTGRRVLVVDDNLDGAESLALMLKLAGHDARMAHNGPDALDLAREFVPEVVFLDIGMPGMDGREVARRMRREPTTARATLVALTGWGSEEDRRQSIAAGFDVHLTKPLGPGSVAQILA